MDKPGSSLPKPVKMLDITVESGMWKIRSSSRTVYFLDLDRSRVMRARGEGSSRFPFDDQWVPLVRVVSRDLTLRPVDEGRVRVGERAEYLTDPRGGFGDYEWRVGRPVTAIERVEPARAVVLREGGLSP